MRHQACVVLILTMLAARCACAASLSTLTVDGYFDNGVRPSPYAVDGAETADVTLAGEWFPSGSCELSVDGVKVAQSDGPLQVYGLPVPEGTMRTYALLLKSGDFEERRTVTVFPYAGYVCSIHTMEACGPLDSQPAGTVRRIKSDGTMEISWSGFWNEASDRSVVTVYRGEGTDGECLGELVDVDGRQEGVFPLCPCASSLEPGRYTLTHFDGVETLLSRLDVRGTGFLLFLR